MLHTKWNILRAMLHCSYKAWLLTKRRETLILSQQEPKHVGNQAELTLDSILIDSDDKLALTAWAHDQAGQNIETGKILHGKQVTSFRVSRYNKQGHKLLTQLNELLSNPNLYDDNKLQKVFFYKLGELKIDVIYPVTAQRPLPVHRVLSF